MASPPNSQTDSTLHPAHLQSRIQEARDTLQATPPDHPDRFAALHNLCVHLVARYSTTHDAADLAQVLALVNESPPCGENRARWFSQLSTLLAEAGDLKQAIQLSMVALAAARGPAVVATLMERLAKTVGMKWKRDGMPAGDAVLREVEQWEHLVPLVNVPDRAGWMERLSATYSAMYTEAGGDGGDGGDLDLAVIWATRAAAATPPGPGHTERGRILANLLITRFMWHGQKDPEDLRQFAALQELFLAGFAADTPERCTERAETLTNLSGALNMLYKRTDERHWLDQAIERLEEALRYCPPPNTVLEAQIQGNLANCLDSRHKVNGAHADLDRAINLTTHALKILEADSSPDRFAVSFNLGNFLERRYVRNGSLEDLRRAIELGKAAVAIDSDSTTRRTFLNNVGNKLERLYRHNGDLIALAEAIGWAQEGLLITPAGDPDFVAHLTSLGNRLQLRYTIYRNEADLQRAIELEERAVAALDPARYGPTYRAGILANLSRRLADRYKNVTQRFEDLQGAIVRAEEALEVLPKDHTERVVYLQHLGGQLMARYQHERGADPADRERALENLKEAIAIEGAFPTVRIQAALLAFELLAGGSQAKGEACEMIADAVRLLPLVSPRALEQGDQQEMLKEYAGLASLAAALVLETKEAPAGALGLLELGRGIISGLRFENRTDIQELWAEDPDLAADFERYRDIVDSPRDAVDQGLVRSPKPELSKRYSASEELTKTIDKIRRKDKFHNFLRPSAEDKDFSDAVSGAETIVLVNVSYRCDALIIQPNSPVRAVRLPALSNADIASKVLEFRNRGKDWGGMLKIQGWLWTTVAGPILTELGFTQTPMTGIDKWPHVWWILTGPLCVFPIHAAGLYSPAEYSATAPQTVLDRVVSSYIPSIKALSYTRKNKAQKDSHSAQNKGKAVLAYMDETPNLKSLSHAHSEIRKVAGLLGIPEKDFLERPSRDAVLRALSDYKIFHFAGHGQSNPVDPSLSCLITADGPVTAQDVVALKLHRDPPQLAYLSACRTGENQVATLFDEGIHLMGAFQLAGFEHVIGSLWAVDDACSVTVARMVYESIVKYGMSDQAVSLGLHSAVRYQRGTVAMVGANRSEFKEYDDDDDDKPVSVYKIGDPLLWGPYIHTGI